MRHTYRIVNGGAEKWIRLEGSVKTQKDGKKYLYAVYSDVTDRQQMEKDLIGANKKMQDIINAIPGGVAIYKVSDIFETVYFSDGVPALSGHTREEFEELIREDAFRVIYAADRERVLEAVRAALKNGTVLDVSFRTRSQERASGLDSPQRPAHGPCF